MSIAGTISLASHCRRAKVGAVIVKNSRVVSTGYNGQPAGCDNNCEENNLTLPTVIHAEANSLINATTADLSGCTMYVTLSPCLRCAALIKQVGINEVVYRKQYSGTHCGIAFLEKYDVKIWKYDGDFSR